MFYRAEGPGYDFYTASHWPDSHYTTRV